jgi:hypothetical protein
MAMVMVMVMAVMMIPRDTRGTLPHCSSTQKADHLMVVKAKMGMAVVSLGTGVRIPTRVMTEIP